MPTVNPWFVYVIEAKNGNFYTGITNNLERRLKEHQSSKKGAKFFRTSQPKNIIYKEVHSSRSEASKRESYIKSLSRVEKIKLICKDEALPTSNRT